MEESAKREKRERKRKRKKEEREREREREREKRKAEINKELTEGERVGDTSNLFRFTFKKDKKL